MAELEGVSQIRRRNFEKLTPKQIAFYDGLLPERESYDMWLRRQPRLVQFKHLGNYKAVDLFNSGGFEVERFVNPEGRSISLKQLRSISEDSYTLPGDTVRFANAKAKLDSMRLWATAPEDFFKDADLRKTLKDYYLLQAGELNGTLSLTNYRGTLPHVKRAMRNRVLSSPPREDQLKFNPITGRYEDVRLYQPNAAVLNNNLKLVKEAEELTERDKEFINSFVAELDGRMSMNEMAVIADNLRIVFTRFRKNGESWANFKAVAQSQIKFDVMNVSSAIETNIRRDSDVLKRLESMNYTDPVLGPTSLQDIHDNFISFIRDRNKWEDKTAPKISEEMRSIFDVVLLKKHPIIWNRLQERDLQGFYLRFVNRLASSDGIDRDQLAVQLGRDLYNSANYTGTRRDWYKLGLDILDAKNVNKLFKLETFGVQKRRMKSRLSGAYFGPYYDTLSMNIRVTDPRIQEYVKLQRSVELGLRVSVTDPKNRLVFRKGYKTYFIDRGLLGYEDTRIPITSTSSFSDFPEEFVEESLVDALNWASETQYRIDEDYYGFIKKLLYFEDDKGKAKYFNDLNEYRKYISARGDTYERFKAMEWLVGGNKSFSNHAFVDHRGRVYDRGLISPQSGETFRPFLNTAHERNFSADDFENLQDQVGAFIGGLSDKLEGPHNSLTIPGRQAIAKMHREELVKIGNHMIRGKPGDVRAVLESPLAQEIDGEDIGKFYRFAIELAKLDTFLGGDYSPSSLQRLTQYKTALALEQDASSSGAQIIALTTRNKQLAELSNVVPTNQKRRLYDEIAASTFDDPRFKTLNLKLGLSEKDLRKAAKAQNMVTFYGAGERTGIMNVEGKLGKVLSKDAGTLVVTATDRDTVLNEISAQAARYEKFDPETAEELKQLRADIRDVFNKGIDPGDDLMEQLWFLQPQTKDLVEKMTRSYDRVVTPDDFKAIAKIMSEYLSVQVPILKDFTRYFGRLAQDFLANAKPSKSAFDWTAVFKLRLRGSEEIGAKPPSWLLKTLGLKSGDRVFKSLLSRYSFWKPGGNLEELIYGVQSPETRKTGVKLFKLGIVNPADISWENLRKGKLLDETKLLELELLEANKLPKSWTHVPWVNFDGNTIEQNFTQVFEERLVYKNPEGEWVNNILQVPQKTTSTWWEELANKEGKFNDIADATKARTAFAVNGNHSNDAVIVKKFHQWGKANNVPTSTIHDAFFANAADMLKARQALRKIYAEVMSKNVIRMTLDEMLARGLPKDLYEKYLEEAIESGLIPVPGKSKIGGRLMTIEDILTTDDILKPVPAGFKNNYGWYGVG